jgi:hypothetical protein
MIPPTEQPPVPPAAEIRKQSSEKVVGVCMVLGSVALGYLAIALPLQEASQHEDEISISRKGVVFVPALLVIGLFLIFTGDKPGQPLGRKGKPSLLGWIVCIGVAVFGILLYEWLKSRLQAYGYTF